MDVGAVLEILQTKGSDYLRIGHEVVVRAERLGLVSPAVSFSCLHDPDVFVMYRRGERGVTLTKGSDEWTSLFGRDGHSLDRSVYSIDLSALDELGSHRPIMLLSALRRSARAKPTKVEIERLLQDYCLRAVQRHRAMIRRSFIDAKIGSGDVGSFCYRLLHEAFPPLLPVEAASVFVLDKLTDELRLRGQVPIRTDGRHLSDITVGKSSESWIEKTFRGNEPFAEYDPSGHLRSGVTAERVALRYFSRLYWPVRLQFRSAEPAGKRMKDPVIGVLRLSNISDTLGGEARPFHCFDLFSVEFIAESLHNIIGSFVDRDVEGFNRDLAYHGAKTPAAGCLRNLRLAARFLFEPEEVAFLHAKEGAIPRQFTVRESGRFPKDELIRAFNNAYAFAISISAQIERANITAEFYASPGQQVDSLFANVIQKSINLAPYFEISHSITSKRAGKPRVAISRLFSLALPPPVVGEEGALTSVFNNLLENSIKYSRRDVDPRIDISWHSEPGFVCVSIRDNGIGIPEEDAHRIFTSGVRSTRATQHTVRGDGLGLAYCKRVINAFGGSIEAIAHGDGLEIQVRLKKASGMRREWGKS